MKTIVFISRFPHTREYKEAKVLKYSGLYRLILVGEKYDPDLFKDSFNEIYSGKKP